MNALFSKLSTWARDKWGRLVVIIGGAATLFDMIPPDPGQLLGPISGYVQNLVGQTGLSVIALSCYLISYLRHQKAARTVRDLHARIADLEQAPHPVLPPGQAPP